MMLQNLGYTSCIRSEAGMNCIRYRQARDTTAPDAFFLDQNDGGADSGRLDAACDRRYLIIQGVAGVGNEGDRFCGGLLNSRDQQTNAGPVISTMKLFQIGVVSDGGNNPTAGTQFDFDALEVDRVDTETCASDGPWGMGGRPIRKQA